MPDILVEGALERDTDFGKALPQMAGPEKSQNLLWLPLGYQRTEMPKPGLQSYGYLILPSEHFDDKDENQEWGDDPVLNKTKTNLYTSNHSRHFPFQVSNSMNKTTVITVYWGYSPPTQISDWFSGSDLIECVNIMA